MGLRRIWSNVAGLWRLFILLSLYSFLLPGSAGAVCTQGVVSWVSLPEGGLANALHVLGDYAYVAYGSGGLQIVHLATDSPQVVGSFPTTAAARDVFVSGDYAYLTMDGLEIINVANKSAPTLTKSRSGGYLNGVHIVGNYAYLAGERYSSSYAYLRIYDVSDPADPDYVGDRVLESGYDACDIYVADGYAYLTACSSGRLYVVDLGSGVPWIDTLKAGCYSGSYAGQGVFAVGGYAYVAEAELHTYDVSDKSAISEVLTAGCTDVCTPNNCLDTVGGRGIYVGGNRAYTGVYNGLYIQDISTPSNPSYVGTVATEGGVAVRDVAPWGNYFVVITANTLQILEACPPIEDADGDGIQDSDDQCPDTADGDESDAYGCSSAQNIEKILEFYAQLDLKGKETVPGLPTNGPSTNMVSFVLGDKGVDKTVTVFDGKAITVGLNKEGGIECGGYQGTLIHWLEALRKSTTSLGAGNRTYGDLFTNVDYGPIQTYWFAHQAVVIYPKGTNWKTKGTVLDPWFIQNTKSYPVYGWGAHFPGVEVDLVTWAMADESDYYTEGFPMYGTGYSEEIEAAITAARIARRAQIEKQKQGVTADCPVDFSLVDTQSGRRIGYFEGEGFVNEIPDAFVTMGYLTGEEDLVWYFGLPEGSYEMTGTGRKDGAFGLKTSYENEGLFDYGNNPITEGGTAGLTLNALQPTAPMGLPDGSFVIPDLVRRPVTFLPCIPLLLQD